MKKMQRPGDKSQAIVIQSRLRTNSNVTSSTKVPELYLCTYPSCCGYKPSTLIDAAIVPNPRAFGPMRCGARAAACIDRPPDSSEATKSIGDVVNGG